MEYHRKRGQITFTAHPQSEIGKTWGKQGRKGWAYIGTTRVKIRSDDHPGLYVYEDVSLLGRLRKFFGRGTDEFRIRCLEDEADDA